MNRNHKGKLRILSALLLAALLLTAMPSFALADSFSAAVNVKKMKVYADANGAKYLGSLSKKTIVTVEDYSDGVAKISYKGATGYVKTSDLRAVSSFAREAVTKCATRVYAAANVNSTSAKVKAGVKVYVLAAKNGVAMVEKDGTVGYMKNSDLSYTVDETGNDETGTETDESSKDTISGSDIVDMLPDQVVDALPDSVIDELQKGEYTSDQLEALKEALEAEYKKQQEEAKKEETKEESVEEIFASGKYSNEKLTYLFATKIMGYNDAAAAGLLANISAESGFRTTANGDSGSSYGICQWYSSRKTRLLNWCSNKGMDSSTLYAQLCFLKYELETYYPSVNRYMKNVENSAQGAYDAAYYFCYHFEAPANKASKSASRGNSAKNIFYPRYAA